MKLTSLYLSHNNLTGELSPSITNLSQLEAFYISNNLITGYITPEFRNRQHEAFDVLEPQQ